MSNKTLGQELKDIRKAFGDKAIDLSKNIMLTPCQLSRIEHDNLQIPCEAADKFAEYYGLTESQRILIKIKANKEVLSQIFEIPVNRVSDYFIDLLNLQEGDLTVEHISRKIRKPIKK